MSRVCRAAAGRRGRSPAGPAGRTRPAGRRRVRWPPSGRDRPPRPGCRRRRSRWSSPGRSGLRARRVVVGEDLGDQDRAGRRAATSPTPRGSAGPARTADVRVVPVELVGVGPAVRGSSASAPSSSRVAVTVVRVRPGRRPAVRSSPSSSPSRTLRAVAFGVAAPEHLPQVVSRIWGGRRRDRGRRGRREVGPQGGAQRAADRVDECGRRQRVVGGVAGPEGVRCPLGAGANRGALGASHSTWPHMRAVGIGEQQHPADLQGVHVEVVDGGRPVRVRRCDRGVSAPAGRRHERDGVRPVTDRRVSPPNSSASRRSGGRHRLPPAGQAAGAPGPARLRGEQRVPAVDQHRAWTPPTVGGPFVADPERVHATGCASGAVSSRAPVSAPDDDAGSSAGPVREHDAHRVQATGREVGAAGRTTTTSVPAASRASSTFATAVGAGPRRGHTGHGEGVRVEVRQEGVAPVGGLRVGRLLPQLHLPDQVAQRPHGGFPPRRAGGDRPQFRAARGARCTGPGARAAPPGALAARSSRSAVTPRFAAALVRNRSSGSSPRSASGTRDGSAAAMAPCSAANAVRRRARHAIAAAGSKPAPARRGSARRRPGVGRAERLHLGARHVHRPVVDQRPAGDRRAGRCRARLRHAEPVGVGDGGVRQGPGPRADEVVHVEGVDLSWRPSGSVSTTVAIFTGSLVPVLVLVALEDPGPRLHEAVPGGQPLGGGVGRGVGIGGGGPRRRPAWLLCRQARATRRQ